MVEHWDDLQQHSIHTKQNKNGQVNEKLKGDPYKDDKMIS